MTSLTKTYLFIFASSIFLLIAACKKDATGLDEEILNQSKKTDGFTYYKKSNSILEKSNGSGHTDPKLKVRYNAIAAAGLDSNGKVKRGFVFPESSLIVKELYDSKDEFNGYAVMYKKSGDANADSNGWVWAVFNGQDKVSQSVTKKGDGCKGCHSGGGNIDGSLMNQSFP